MICGTPSQPWLCKTAWTSRRYPACWATMTPDSHSAPTPTPPDKTGRSSGHDGCLHGADVVKTKIRKCRTGGATLLPGTLVSIVSFRQVGHGVGHPSSQHFSATQIVKICNKKHPKSKDFRCFLELIARFELATSSLPIITSLVMACCNLFYFISRKLWGARLSRFYTVAVCRSLL